MLSLGRSHDRLCLLPRAMTLLGEVDFILMMVLVGAAIPEACKRMITQLHDRRDMDKRKMLIGVKKLLLVVRDFCSRTQRSRWVDLEPLCHGSQDMQGLTLSIQKNETSDT